MTAATVKRAWVLKYYIIRDTKMLLKYQLSHSHCAYFILLNKTKFLAWLNVLRFLDTTVISLLQAKKVVERF